MARPPTDLEVARALTHNETLRVPEPQELSHDEVLGLFEDTQPEIIVTDCGHYYQRYIATFGNLEGYGRTPLDAIVDLLDQEEAASVREHTAKMHKTYFGD